MHFRLRRSIGVLKHEKSTDADAYFLLILILYPTKKNTFSPKIANIFTWWAESMSGIGLCLSVRPSSLRRWSLSLLVGFIHLYNHTYSESLWWGLLKNQKRTQIQRQGQRQRQRKDKDTDKVPETLGICAIFLKSRWLTHSKYDYRYLTLVILFTPITLVILLQSYNQFYRADCVTISVFFSSSNICVILPRSHI